PDVVVPMLLGLGLRQRGVEVESISVRIVVARAERAELVVLERRTYLDPGAFHTVGHLQFLARSRWRRWWRGGWRGAGRHRAGRRCTGNCRRRRIGRRGCRAGNLVVPDLN